MADELVAKCVLRGEEKKSDGPGVIQTFADGSSSETCPNGSMLLREAKWASALALGTGVKPACVRKGRPARYDEPAPPPEEG